MGDGEDKVSIDQPEQMNLLGLLLAGFLRKQLTHPRMARKAARIRGAYGIRAADMAITLTFTPETIRISKGFSKKTRARIFGSMEEMIALVAGSGSSIAAIIAVLEGRIHIRGNPFALLRLLPLMIKNVKVPAPVPAIPASPSVSPPGAGA